MSRSQRISGEHINAMLDRMHEIAQRSAKFVQGDLNEVALDECQVLTREWQAFSSEVLGAVPKFRGAFK